MNSEPQKPSSATSTHQPPFHVLASDVTLRNPAGPTFAFPEKLLRTRTSSKGTSAVMSAARLRDHPNVGTSCQDVGEAAAFPAAGPSPRQVPTRTFQWTLELNFGGLDFAGFIKRLRSS